MCEKCELESGWVDPQYDGWAMQAIGQILPDSIEEKYWVGKRDDDGELLSSGWHEHIWKKAWDEYFVLASNCLKEWSGKNE